MKLYGSLPSPYVRRNRIWMLHQGIEHQFIELNIFDHTDRQRLIQLNPTRKIPMIEDGEQVVFDSGVIYRYLASKYDVAPLSWQQENYLTMINAANDSLVELLVCQRSGLDTNEDVLFFNLQRERVAETLKVLDQHIAHFSDWQYPSICLFCLLDWIKFRELFDLSDLTSLNQFYQSHSQRSEVLSTDPRS